MAFRYEGPLSPKQIRFLKCYEMCASVTQSARWTKCTRQAHGNWLRESPQYKAAFEEAKIAAAQTLEDEAIRRCHQGIKKAVWHKGKVVGYEMEYSDSLMALMLKGALPRKYRDNASVELTGKEGEQLFPVTAIESYFKSRKDGDEDFETQP